MRSFCGSRRGLGSKFFARIKIEGIKILCEYAFCTIVESRLRRASLSLLLLGIGVGFEVIYIVVQIQLSFGSSGLLGHSYGHGVVREIYFAVITVGDYRRILCDGTLMMYGAAEIGIHLLGNTAASFVYAQLVDRELLHTVVNFKVVVTIKIVTAFVVKYAVFLFAAQTLFLAAKISLFSCFCSRFLKLFELLLNLCKEAGDNRKGGVEELSHVHVIASNEIGSVYCNDRGCDDEISADAKDLDDRKGDHVSNESAVSARLPVGIGLYGIKADVTVEMSEGANGGGEYQKNHEREDDSRQYSSSFNILAVKDRVNYDEDGNQVCSEGE